MNGKERNSGIDLIGDIPWGTHFCQFYENQKDLTDMLVPYFKAGLERNECCMWVTAEPLGEEHAREAIRKAMPDFDRCLEKGQIEIVPYNQWYLRGDKFDLQKVVKRWIDRLDHALKQGYDGLRLTDNTAGLEKRDWNIFTRYEAEINRVIGNYRMIVLCTYSLDRCNTAEIINVANNHQFVLIRRQGNWNVMESAEIKQMKEALCGSEENFRRSLDDSPLGIRIVTAKGETLYTNRAIIDMYGYADIEDLKMTPCEKSYTPKSYAEHQVRKEKRQRGEYVPSNYEISILRKNGEIRHLEVFRKEVLWNGETQFQVLYHDITERKQAEETLRESEKLYRSLFENMLNGFAYCKMLFNQDKPQDFIYLTVNRAFEELTGLKNVVGKKVSEVIPGIRESDPGLFEIYGRVVLTGIPEKFEIYVDALEMWFSISVYSLGKEYFVSVFDVITERKRLEAELQRVEKLESIGTLAGGIAHDFNNLLTGILGNITLAERHIEPKGEAAKRLLDAKKASLRAKDLTQQLMTFGRGGVPIKEVASIAELLEESSLFALRGSNVKCEFFLPDDLWPIEIDRGQMSQVITNLVINADEAMPEGGILDVRAKNTVIERKGVLPLPKGDYVEITVEDHGVGIPKKNLGRIFDPYFTTKQKGTGLGLATTYSIIKNHNGHITVESEPGVGTTFFIYLPVSKKPVIEKEEVEETEKAAFRGRKRILVMDDEEMIREMLSNTLSSAGLEVELASDGKEAIERYEKARESGQPFDAVIMDLTIPGGMGGKEAIKKLIEIDPNVKAIVSSGYSTDPIMADFRKYGFSAVMIKPYSVGEMERTLRRILVMAKKNRSE